MFDELGNISEGEISEKREEINQFSKLMLNIKVNRTLHSAVYSLMLSYPDIAEIIIANLLVVDKAGYSRDTSYNEPKKYNKKEITTYRLLRAIDELVNIGMINNYIAPRSFNNDYVKETSYIEATTLLKETFSNAKNVKDSIKSFVKDRQCVILKDKEGKRIDYKDNDYSKTLRSKLTEYNQYASEHDVMLDDTKLNTTLDAHHKNTLDEYGRFFGATYQTIKKEQRKDMTINSSNIIEIDFQNLHFRMMLDMYLLSHHVDINADLYSLPLSEDQQSNPDNRKAIKSMFNMLINCNSKASALQAMNNAVYHDSATLGDFDSAKAVYECLVDAYPFVFNNPSVMANIHSGKPLAATLQKKEAAITLEIMTTCKQVGFLVCPIHDSYTADAGNAYLLAKIIGDSYRKEMGTTNGIAVSVIMGDKTWKQIV